MLSMEVRLLSMSCVLIRNGINNCGFIAIEDASIVSIMSSFRFALKQTGRGSETPFDHIRFMITIRMQHVSHFHKPQTVVFDSRYHYEVNYLQLQWKDPFVDKWPSSAYYETSADGRFVHLISVYHCRKIKILCCIHRRMLSLHHIEVKDDVAASNSSIALQMRF